jgi:hypothetical protein
VPTDPSATSYRQEPSPTRPARTWEVASSTRHHRRHVRLELLDQAGPDDPPPQGPAAGDGHVRAVASRASATAWPMPPVTNVRTCRPPAPGSRRVDGSRPIPAPGMARGVTHGISPPSNMRQPPTQAPAAAHVSPMTSALIEPSPPAYPCRSRQPVASPTTRHPATTPAHPGPSPNPPRPGDRVGPSAPRSNHPARRRSVLSPWSYPSVGATDTFSTRAAPPSSPQRRRSRPASLTRLVPGGRVRFRSPCDL